MDTNIEYIDDGFNYVLSTSLYFLIFRCLNPLSLKLSLNNMILLSVGHIDKN